MISEETQRALYRVGYSVQSALEGFVGYYLSKRVAGPFPRQEEAWTAVALYSDHRAELARAARDQGPAPGA